MKSKIKRKLFFSLIAVSSLIVVPISVVSCSTNSSSKSNVTENGIEYITNSNNTITITGLSKKITLAQNFNIPETIDGKNVTIIANNAFSGLENLGGKLSLPNTIESIGNSAFQNTKFSGQLILPDNLKNIGTYAFSGNKFSGELKIPTNVNTIGTNAFSGNQFSVINISDNVSADQIENLGFISSNTILKYKKDDYSYYESTNKWISQNANWAGCFTINKTGTGAIINKMPANVSNNNLVIPNTVQQKNSGGIMTTYNVVEIEAKVFANQNLSGTLTLPNKLTIIGDNAFSGNDFNSNITLPSDLTTIGNSAFANSNLNGDLKIPDSVTTIGNSAFANNNFRGDNLSLGKNIEEIGNSAFANCKFNGDIKIPDTVKTIGNSAFANNQFTGNIKISNTVTSIGEYAFANNQLSGNITIGTGIVTIGNFAFANNQISSNLNLANSTVLTTIGAEAFVNNSIGILTLPSQYDFSKNLNLTSVGFQSQIIWNTNNYFFNDGTNKWEIGFIFNNLIFSINKDKDTKTVTLFANFLNSGQTNLTIPDSVSIDGNKYDVTNIGPQAIVNMKIIGVLTLPKTLISIDANAFSGNNFSGDLVIPDKVTSIGQNAFSGNDFSGDLVIPDKVTSIGQNAFSGNDFSPNSKIEGKLTNENDLINMGVINDKKPQNNFIIYQKETYFLNQNAKQWIKVLVENNMIYQNTEDNNLTLVDIFNPNVINGTLSINSTITIDKITYTINKIDPNTFINKYYSFNLVIPNTVTSIPSNLFKGNNFETITIENNSINESEIQNIEKPLWDTTIIIFNGKHYKYSDATNNWVSLS